MSSPQEKMLSNIVAIDGDFATVQFAVAMNTEKEFVANLRAYLLAAGYTNMAFRGFIIQNTAAGDLEIYTKAGTHSSGLLYATTVTLPFFPFSETPSNGLYLFCTAAANLRVAVMY